MSFHIRVNARGIVINNDKILLNVFGDDEYYNIPGGGVELGETVKEAVAREILEETGLEVSVGDLIYTLEYEPNNCKFIHGKTHSLSLVFRCFLDGVDTIKQPVLPDIDPNNGLISKPKWVNISKLKDIKYLPYIHNELMEYLETNKFSPLFLEEPLKKR